MFNGAFHTRVSGACDVGIGRLGLGFAKSRKSIDELYTSQLFRQKTRLTVYDTHYIHCFVVLINSRSANILIFDALVAYECFAVHQ